MSAGASPVLVARDSAYAPHFRQGGDTLQLVYSTAAGVDVWDGYGQTKQVRVVGGVPAGPNETLWAGGSYSGGISCDGRYLVAGLMEARILDLWNPSVGALQVHGLTFADTTTGLDVLYYVQADGESASSSRVFSSATLHWDYGTPTAFMHPWISGYTQGKWAQHEILFVSDIHDSTLKCFVAPSDAELPDPQTVRPPPYPKATVWGWSPQWSNYPYFAAAPLQVSRRYGLSGARQYTYNNETVCILNLRDSTYLKVVQSINLSSASGTNMRWPRVSVALPPGFQEDSTWLTSALATRKPAGTPRGGGTMRAWVQDAVLRASQPMHSVAVADMRGRIVVRLPAAGCSVKLPPASPGAYVLNIRAPGGQGTQSTWCKTR